MSRDYSEYGLGDVVYEMKEHNKLMGYLVDEMQKLNNNLDRIRIITER